MNEDDFRRSLASAQEQRLEDVAFHKAHPYDQVTGDRLAKEFIKGLTEAVESWEVGKPSDDLSVPHYEVEMFFTAEQRATVKALHDRWSKVLIERYGYDEDDL